MNTPHKRKDIMPDPKAAKRVKKECSYGDGCYRRNPAHFREFSHPHLESILDSHRGGDYEIPPKFSIQKQMVLEQLEVIVEKQLYEPKSKVKIHENQVESKNTEDKIEPRDKNRNPEENNASSSKETVKELNRKEITRAQSKVEEKCLNSTSTSREKSQSPVRKKMEASQSKARDPDYRAIVPPTRRIDEFLKVVAPVGKMAAKHAASAPYHIFYTTITDARVTHTQPFSITFQELLDPSLGELKCSLQINFMVEPGWLLAQYYFAGYSNKKLTILYGEDDPQMRTLSKKKPHVDAHLVSMNTPFGKHHTKMMLLCYEDGSLRVVVSTANLYIDDWENRTQGLWFSPPCPELPPEAMPHDGESPTMFKRHLLKYLNHYHLPQLACYVERVKRCDFSHIKMSGGVKYHHHPLSVILGQNNSIKPIKPHVFLVASVQGSHFDQEWGMTRVASLLRQHCAIPGSENGQWPLIAQASSLGSYGAQPNLWLTGDFLHHFTKVKNHPQALAQPPRLRLIYPSLENVKQSHDGLLGGGCLPYSAEINNKQPWLKDFLFQWKATHTGRDKAMPHIKSYSRISPDGKRAAYYLLTSGNASKAAWGQINKGNGALRLMSYEAGVLFFPSFVINKEFFSLDKSDADRLLIPYDLPPTKYTSDMSPWVSDYLM